jgi:putative PIG3 family NAD(P)H quinone oxidoreductase
MSGSLPTTMRAVEIAVPGGPEVLRVAERPVPQPEAGQALIEVAAAGVNRPDVLQRQGRYPPPPGASDIPGLEVAGRIVELGAGASGFERGDRVCALVAGGGYAEYCVAPTAQCLAIPDGIEETAAAGVPETFFTVWTNVFERGRLGRGEWLLVHGGASGIGTTAIMLAKVFGARVIATAGSPEKCAACERLGAERGVDYRSEDFVAVVKQLTEERGVDVILDMVGGGYVARNLDCLATEGRLVQIAVLEGARAEISLLPFLRRRLTLTGSTLRARSVEEKGAIASALRERVWPLLASGRVRPVIDRILPFEQATEAHRVMEASEHIGKIVLRMRPTPGC